MWDLEKPRPREMSALGQRTPVPQTFAHIALHSYPHTCRRPRSVSTPHTEGQATPSSSKASIPAAWGGEGWVWVSDSKQGRVEILPPPWPPHDPQMGILWLPASPFPSPASLTNLCDGEGSLGRPQENILPRKLVAPPLPGCIQSLWSGSPWGAGPGQNRDQRGHPGGLER